MRIAMYHYVRPEPGGLHSWQYDSIESFIGHLDYFEKNGGVVNRQEYLDWVYFSRPVRSNYLLTFDDGLKDHYRHVLPILIDRGLFGVFFPAISPLKDNQVLKVNALQFISGSSVPSSELFRKLTDSFSAQFIEQAIQIGASIYNRSGYRASPEEYCLKTMVNWMSPCVEVDLFLQHLIDEFCPDVTADSLYMNFEELGHLLEAGMLVGNHGYSHLIYSNCASDVIKQDIAKSTHILFQEFGEMIFPAGFCYPHGIMKALCPRAIELISNLGYLAGFAVGESDSFNSLDCSPNLILPRRTGKNWLES